MWIFILLVVLGAGTMIASLFFGNKGSGEQSEEKQTAEGQEK
jgi:flagellar basal body-associated protein FliL